jgi:Tfp pilus assembly protein PilO
MAELHSAAEGSGVRLKVLRQNGKGSYKKQSIVLYLEAEGNYEKLVKFLQAVETEGSFKNLQEFMAKGNEKNGNLEISGVVSAYIN